VPKSDLVCVADGPVSVKPVPRRLNRPGSWAGRSGRAHRHLYMLSWRWIFFINIPILAVLGHGLRQPCCLRFERRLGARPAGTASAFPCLTGVWPLASVSFGFERCRPRQRFCPRAPALGSALLRVGASLPLYFNLRHGAAWWSESENSNRIWHSSASPDLPTSFRPFDRADFFLFPDGLRRPAVSFSACHFWMPSGWVRPQRFEYSGLLPSLIAGRRPARC